MKKLLAFSLVVIFSFGFTLNSGEYGNNFSNCPYLNQMHKQVVQDNKSECPYLNRLQNDPVKKNSAEGVCPYLEGLKNGKSGCPYLNNEKSKEVDKSDYKYFEEIKSS